MPLSCRFVNPLPKARVLLNAVMDVVVVCYCLFFPSFCIINQAVCFLSWMNQCVVMSKPFLKKKVLYDFGLLKLVRCEPKLHVACRTLTNNCLFFLLWWGVVSRGCFMGTHTTSYLYIPYGFGSLLRATWLQNALWSIMKICLLAIIPQLIFFFFIYKNNRSQTWIGF